MPAQDLLNGVDTLLESHEARLQRVESGIQTCNISLAETRVEIKNIAETVRDGFEALGTKMDVSHVQHADLKGAIQAVAPRLEKLEAEAEARRQRGATARKSGIMLLLAGAGAFIGKAGEWLWIVMR